MNTTLVAITILAILALAAAIFFVAKKGVKGKVAVKFNAIDNLSDNIASAKTIVAANNQKDQTESEKIETALKTEVAKIKADIAKLKTAIKKK